LYFFFFAPRRIELSINAVFVYILVSRIYIYNIHTVYFIVFCCSGRASTVYNLNRVNCDRLYHSRIHGGFDEKSHWKRLTGRVHIIIKHLSCGPASTCANTAIIITQFAAKLEYKLFSENAHLPYAYASPRAAVINYVRVRDYKSFS